MGYKDISFLIVYSILLSVIKAQHEHDNTARSLYLSNIQPKGGWRPIMTSSGLTSYNLANVLSGSTSIGQKFLTGPALIETKVISPHIVSVSSPVTGDIFSGGMLSTSTRPLVTREVKNIAQAYKPSIYPQGSLNFNAPVNSYLNPFALPSNMNHYKSPGSYQYDSNVFMRHPQGVVGHRPPYNKVQGQMMMGKRYKQNQLQAQMLHQLASTQYYPTYTKKPIESFARPPNDNLLKQGSNHHKYVNPQDSLDAQTKHKPTQASTLAAVSTYKPPLGSHFHQFDLKEEPFGPIPSSILGSFSSFGHATVQARDPTENKVISSTKSPFSTTQPFTSYSTIANIKHQQYNDIKATSSVNFQPQIKDDFTINLVPPSHQEPFKYLQNYTTSGDKNKVSSANDFIPSPVDPLSKLHNNQNKYKAETYSSFTMNTGNRKPELSSFFETTLSPISTVDPFEPQSTNAIPNNLLVQVPPPYTGAKNQNTPYKESKFQQSFTSITHGKHGTLDEVKYYPPRGHEYFEKVPKNTHSQKVKDKSPHKGITYEVTENWGTSGEAYTQPTLHTWVNPSQSYKNFNSYVPKVQYNVEHSKRVVPPPPPPPPFFPTPMSSSAPEITSPGDLSTIYPSGADSTNVNSFFNQLENSLSTLTQSEGGDESHDLAAPDNVTTFNEYKSSTEFIEETTAPTTIPAPITSRRKPSKYRVPVETTTISVTEGDSKDFTTVHYETYKEHAHETENELQSGEFATIPPNKHFKRPVLTTVTSVNHWEDDQSRKRNKNRRRKPEKQTPTEVNSSDSITTTEQPRTNKYKTTPEQDSYRSRNKFRFNKNRYNKPDNDSNNNTQAPPTPRQKWNTRVKPTTPISLDLEDLGEVTTHQSHFKFPETNAKQSSIMKIAKDSQKSPSKIVSAYDNLSDFPDYSHKQDEKDTPTSDIAISSVEYVDSLTIEHKDKESNEKPSLGSVADVIASPTLPALSEDNISANSINQGTRSENLFTEQKSGSRGTTKADGTKTDSELSATNVDASPTTPTSKVPRLKVKANKYDSNRPRFSVKDYKNRLNHLSTTTSTEKPSNPTETGPKLKFPSRSRFPNLKEHTDNKPVDSNSTTESPRRKFAPKDPRHRGEDIVEDKQEEKVRTPSPQIKNTPIIKPINTFRSGLRRDSNRTRVPVTSEAPVETPQEDKPVETLKRPTLPSLRKRISQKNISVETPSETKISEVSDIFIEPKVENVTEVKVEDQSDNQSQSAESSIMKIAKDDKRRQDDNTENPIDPSQRVSDLTLASSKEYNTPGLFKSVSPNSRRIPSYFTIATDDPILPIEAFFPQLNQKKEA